MNREHRKQLASVIRQYLDGGISAFEFDELVDPYRSSDDPTVEHVACAVWLHYDDCKDHHVNLTKPEWDYFQRLLLVLDSTHHIIRTTKYRWSLRQLAACISLLGLGLTVSQFGLGVHLLLFVIPLGLMSICIAHWGNRLVRRPAYSDVLIPFSTFAELRTTYDAAPQFRKKRHPMDLPGRRIRSATMDILLQIPSHCMWVILSPIPLFFQMFPASETHTSVIAT